MDFIFEVQKILIRENKKTKKHFYSIIKMSKEYHCVQVNDEKICNETNPDKFIKGRYTTCINCKNKYLKEYRQKVKNSKELESNMNLIEKIINLRSLKILKMPQNCLNPFKVLAK
jgi:hypothetical protein